jgi:hypothetical protein
MWPFEKIDISKYFKPIWVVKYNPISEIQNSRKDCSTCRFCANDTCRRHAPIYTEDTLKRVWPRVVASKNYPTGNTWCGDWEKRN